MTFVFDAKLLSLSLTYDGFTVYFDKDGQVQPEARPMVRTLVVNACNEMRERILPESKLTPEAKLNLEKCENELKTGALHPERMVHQGDNDHTLYHQDIYPLTAPHVHVKTQQLLTMAQITLLLDTFEKYKLLDTDESKAFLKAYALRFEQALSVLENKLSGKKIEDLVTINNHIKACHDNDILIHLQQHFLNNKFDYLRDRTGVIKTSFWQGTVSQAGNVGVTSKSWAMIEKAFSLQLAQNIKQHCNYTEALASERANQLRAHPFFSLKRHVVPGITQTLNNRAFETFSLHNTEEFEKEYSTHFNKYR